ncbi:MAG TPA: hypothetical protein VE570_09985 [Thermoleophilaceae bacterium]|jgi:uncharacterized membrane protein|nr:hypothetical protein [Thermoleophilaceae bacterium]
MDALRRVPRTTLAAVTAALLTIALAFGYWLNVGHDDKEVVAWIVVSIVGSVIAAALLLRFVPATESEADGNAPARRALVLGAVALVALVVFWTGLPIILGLPALVLAAEGRARSGTYGQGAEATAGALLGGFAALAAVVLLVAGA